MVEISSLTKPPAQSLSCGSSSAGGALGVTPGDAMFAVLCIGEDGIVLDGDRFTAMFPM